MVGVVLAPHYSVLSVGDYISRAAKAAEALSIRSNFVERWGDDDALIELLADRVTAAIERLGGPERSTEVVFTAHSLPERILELGDHYADELSTTATLVARRAGVSHFRTGWQSAGRTPEPWLGPDLLPLLSTLAEEGVTDVVVCPAGFTSDHLEVLYDLDIEAAARARELGLGFTRTSSLNDEPKLGALLAHRVVDLDPDGQGSSS
jgi:ferrochelatase